MSVKTNHTCDHSPLFPQQQRKGDACSPAAPSLTPPTPHEGGVPRRDSHPAACRPAHRSLLEAGGGSRHRAAQGAVRAGRCPSFRASLRPVLTRGAAGPFPLPQQSPALQGKNEAPQVPLLFSLAVWISVKPVPMLFRNRNEPEEAQAPLRNLKGNVTYPMSKVHQCSSWPWKP